MVDAVVLTGHPVGGDVFLPGSLTRAVARRLPKATIADDWSRPVGVIRSAVELPLTTRAPAHDARQAAVAASRGRTSR